MLVNLKKMHTRTALLLSVINLKTDFSKLNCVGFYTKLNVFKSCMYTYIQLLH